ncbi:Origin recognition complex subunit [Thalictrum thalictroides]|uniref:Origin recognition complex subunit 1 n=1 Tax=Thalictrum thalictroides TaxID=46969 RepID=A0A7J6W6Y0_THATH|nr:Origin recognition complex subunit [Thalictrum thalictroides]
MSMTETPKKPLRPTPKPKRSSNLTPKHSPSSILSFAPETPASLRRSSRRIASIVNPKTPQKPPVQDKFIVEDAVTKTPKSVKKPSRRKASSIEASPISAPVSPDVSEPKRRKRSKDVKLEKKEKKKRVYYKKVVYDGGEFEIGDDVYVKRREDASSDDEDPEEEECRICFNAGETIMIECDDCLGGFHLKCLKPPLKEVPEGDWICRFCHGRKSGKKVELPMPPGKKLSRTAKEKLLSSDLWAVRMESLWKEPDGTYWFRGRWYIIPEETAAGRQPHNLRRELYRTNDFADVEMESVLRHCSVMSPKEFSKATNGGDDVFLCEYEYDVHWHSFKRLAEIDNEKEDDKDSDSDEEWECHKDLSSDTDGDLDLEEESLKGSANVQLPTHQLAANSRKGQIYGLQKIGTKKIPDHVRCRKQTVLEKAQATLLLATLPKHLPCRNKEMDDIAAFIKGAICDDQCLGRCLYIHGVPGTGKTMTVLSVMRNLRSEFDAGSIKPYCFIEINGLKLASPESIYKVIYEAISGHRVGWRKALQLLNERFSDDNKLGKEDNRPCVLLIDELDLLVTRNQSVLYNILDWPTKPHSKLVVIGIANTMDLPEKLLPRISSRMGMQRLCFGPYNYQQLQEIISSRLKGIDAFEKQAVEFASRKVAAISGDARRALEICRRAAEVADYRLKKLSSLPDFASAGKPLVSMADVEAAIQEMFQAPHIQVMKRCSRLSKIFLTAMVHELYRTGMGETTFEKLAVTLSRLCASNGEAFPGWDTLLKVGCKLGECRIIICEAGAKHRLQKLQLNFPSDDVAFALKDSPELPWLAKFL